MSEPLGRRGRQMTTRLLEFLDDANDVFDDDLDTSDDALRPWLGNLREKERGDDVSKRAMSETDLLQAVLDLAGWYGLLTHHCRPARTAKGWATPIQGDAGFVDLVIAGRHGVLLRELKSPRGRPTADQQRWAAVLAVAGANVNTWRPTDWTSGRIQGELRAAAGKVVA